uniref:NADPH-dependent glutamate synthase beta chain n=1 Tax=Candidatus Kentrum sp. TUN TaxID=2126343 RepID=A0A450ZAX9_9GAMM|nr:MAG: NADPH-dependent glutamate synthase beta chain [Candidatus Kentron sp. TUN]
MATPWSKTYRAENHTFRKFKDGDKEWSNWEASIFVADSSHKCPTYVHRTPPCQGSCPAGEDIRGWLQIVRGIEKPPEGMSWQEYAFRRSTDANPFPSQMGRVCPAPCQDGCNRNEVEDFVHINAVEQYIGDYAIEHGFLFECPEQVSGKKVAIIGGGPAGMTAAYQLRRKGHGSVIFDDHQMLGGMLRYGIPGYRVPRDNLDKEIKRIIDMGDIEVRTGIKVGKDVSIGELEREFDAILWTIGCQAGRALPVSNSDAPNCITGVQFLDAFNSERMKVSAQRIVCVGGGDTSIDVVSVARRLGHIQTFHPNEQAEDFVHGFIALDAATVANAEGATVTLTSLFKKEEMTAAEHEVQDALTEGVTVLDGVMPLEVLLNNEGRARALKMAKCTVDAKGVPKPEEGTEFEIECDLVVSAIGQGGDLKGGLEVLDNGRGFIDADKYYQLPKRSGHFVAGDIIRPHLLTTAVGQASIASQSISDYLVGKGFGRRPKVDVHHFNLLNKLRESKLEPKGYDHSQHWGTCDSDWAVHNFEDRSTHEVVHAEDLFLGHFGEIARNVREEQVPTADEVLGHFEERIIALSEEETVAEANRCMSCGMCFECDNCVIFCPQDAVFRVKKGESTTGRYVDTDYARCIGCHVCADVCPTGYIDMGLGE